jgi:naphthoate synthase
MSTDPRSDGDYATILYREEGPLAYITLNRPGNGNMFNKPMLLELRSVLERNRAESRTRVVILTGAGERFFCIGGEKDGLENTLLYPGALPVVDVYEAIERHPKPIIASVNGFAVGGGNVLQVVCDLTIAKESAVFRQVGPSMGSYDAGYGTWCLEDLVGRKRAKEIWFSNEKMTAQYAREIGLINRVVPDDQLVEATRAWAMEIATRGSHALNAIKASFAARTGGVAGLSRITQDLLMPYYLRTEESRELGESFREHRDPDPDKFGN